MGGEHFGESTFLGESTLGRTLFSGRALRGEHFFFVVNSIFFEGRALDATMTDMTNRVEPQNEAKRPQIGGRLGLFW